MPNVFHLKKIFMNIRGHYMDIICKKRGQITFIFNTNVHIMPMNVHEFYVSGLMTNWGLIVTWVPSICFPSSFLLMYLVEWEKNRSFAIDSEASCGRMSQWLMPQGKGCLIDNRTFTTFIFCDSILEKLNLFEKMRRSEASMLDVLYSHYARRLWLCVHYI